MRRLTKRCSPEGSSSQCHSGTAAAIQLRRHPSTTRGRLRVRMMCGGSRAVLETGDVQASTDVHEERVTQARSQRLDSLHGVQGV